MRHKPASYYRSLVITGLVAAFTGAVIGVAATQLGWPTTLAILAVPVLALAAVKALRRANAKHAQIVSEEVDEPRERDEFAMELRIPPTDTTGETR
jgi:membrane protein implicated in regulation of membrane protease activity